ncbi:MAG TPA: hypothetical protein VFD60_08990, partial [Nitrososphaeraceae archaeon]|nr:hypothetical protein [Nitrososphaeraceae archaeon]
YRSFKYNSSLDSPDDTTRRGYLDNNLSFESCTIGNTQTEKEGSRSFFVEHYRKHSKQLVDAFQEWKTQLMFTSYEYKEGLLTPDRIEPDYIPYMKQMKEHLNKAYSDLLPNPLDIKTKRKNLCNKLQNMMEYKTDILPSRRSFEKIIIDRIKKICHTLKEVTIYNS